MIQTPLRCNLQEAALLPAATLSRMAVPQTDARDRSRYHSTFYSRGSSAIVRSISAEASALESDRLVKKLNQDNNFHYFTLSLVTLLLCATFIGHVPDGFGGLVLRVLVMLTVLVAYLSLNFGVRWRRFVMVMAAILFLLNLLNENVRIPYLAVIDLIFTLIFFIAAAAFSARQVLLSGRANNNTLVGSMAIYLLLGLIWATLYLLVLEFIPDAFNGIEYQHWSDNFSTALYFSYSTLASLGYGDISPTAEISRTLAYFESVCGAFYLAIVVASLIGARSGHNADH